MQLAFLNSAHREENNCVLFHEMRLGHITNFLRNKEGIGFRERVGKLPVGMGGGQRTNVCSLENLLGLPMDDQGRAHQLRVEIIGADPGERRSAWRALCDKLSALSNGATTLFNNLMQAQQIIAILIREDWRYSHQVLEHYLRVPPEFRDIAIIRSKYYI